MTRGSSVTFRSSMPAFSLSTSTVFPSDANTGCTVSAVPMSTGTGISGCSGIAVTSA